MELDSYIGLGVVKDEVVYLLLHHTQSDVAVQLRQQILDLLRRRQLLLGGLFVAGLGGGGKGRLFLRRRGAAAIGTAAGGGGELGRTAGDVFEGRAPEVAVHALHVVLRHGADHVQLLENDLVFLVHRVTSSVG